MAIDYRLSVILHAYLSTTAQRNLCFLDADKAERSMNVRKKKEKERKTG